MVEVYAVAAPAVIVVLPYVQAIRIQQEDLILASPTSTNSAIYYKLTEGRKVQTI